MMGPYFQQPRKKINQKAQGKKKVSGEGGICTPPRHLVVKSTKACGRGKVTCALLQSNTKTRNKKLCVTWLTCSHERACVRGRDVREISETHSVWKATCIAIYVQKESTSWPPSSTRIHKRTKVKGPADRERGVVFVELRAYATSCTIKVCEVRLQGIQAIHSFPQRSQKEPHKACYPSSGAP